MSEMVVWFEALSHAADLWDGQAEQLQGAVSTLDAADPTQLGPVVAPVAREWLAHWQQRVVELETSAGRFADALHRSGSDVLHADVTALERLQRLLPAGAPDLPGAPR